MMRLEHIRAWKGLVFIALIGLVPSGCEEPPIPKPRGYPRTVLPDHEYAAYEHPCGFGFEVPVHAKIERIQQEHELEFTGHSCWFNCAVPLLNAKIHCTYLSMTEPIQLAEWMEDAHQMVFSHELKATGITTQTFEFPGHRVSGVLYRLSGPVASPVQFFATDSTSHFLRGSLYFDHAPNPDSLKPSLQHMEQDIVHLIESLHWTSSADTRQP